MSGTQYNTGTNIVLAVNSSGGTNVGTGTIQQNTLMPSTMTPVAGVFLVSITAVDGMGNATFTIYKTDFSGVQSSTMGGPVAPGSHIDYVGPAGEFAIAFTITNNATVAGVTHQYVVGDGFYLYVSQVGQNVSPNVPIELSGLAVTVQQFQTYTATPPLYWGAAIQAMFNYCSLNPGVVGIIPPGFYLCDDPNPQGYYQLNIQSNMTIIARGAVICTSHNATAGGDYGFLTVQDTALATGKGTGIHDVTIIGGTWGGTGVNGALSTNNDSSVLYGGTRTGKVISLFVDHDLTLIDVTVRGFKNIAFYLYCNTNLTTHSCSFWNSDGTTGTGGFRISNGNNIRCTNTNGVSGDDALQFAPAGNSGGLQGPGITNAYFIGGNVLSLRARAFVATLASANSTDVMTSYIKNVGFVGICGNIGQYSVAVCYISNQNSTNVIQNVSVSECKLDNFTGMSTSTNAIWIQAAGVITGTTMSGGVRDVYFSNVSTSELAGSAVYLDGYNSLPTASTPYVSLSNINFRDCLFYAPGAKPAFATVYVRGCLGFSFRQCSIYAYASSSCMVLGEPDQNQNYAASNGLVDGCLLYTSSSSTTGQPARIQISIGDMNVFQGWSKFYLGAGPGNLNPTGAAAAGLLVGPSATNTFIDCLDFRGLGVMTPAVSNSGSIR